MFTASIVVVLGFGGLVWWLQFSPAAAARKREENQRALEHPDHERELELAQVKSEISRLKGWTSTGA